MTLDVDNRDDRVSELIADYVVRVRHIDMESAEAIRCRILDSFCCAVTAYDHPAAVAVREYARRHVVANGQVIWGSSLHVPAEYAALANATSVRCLDFNDAYFGDESLHPSDMIPGIMASGQASGADGDKILRGISIAYDVSVTLASLLALRKASLDQVNITGIGACAGIAHVLGLSSDEIRNAISLTIVPHIALREARAGQISMWKGIAAAQSVRNAFSACLMAQSGVRGPARPFEGDSGILKVAGADVEDVLWRASQGLAGDGQQGRVLETHVKRWPVGYVAHSAVEATEIIRQESGARDDVCHIGIETFRVASELMDGPEKRAPLTRETADHSLPYVVYYMLMNGTLDEHAFTERSFTDAKVHAFLRDSISVEVCDDLTTKYPAEQWSRVSVEYADGSSRSASVSVPRGHASRPFTTDQVVAKFEEAVSQVMPSSQVMTLRDAILDARSGADFAHLGELALVE